MFRFCKYEQRMALANSNVDLFAMWWLSKWPGTLLGYSLGRSMFWFVWSRFVLEICVSVFDKAASLFHTKLELLDVEFICL